MMKGILVLVSVIVISQTEDVYQNLYGKTPFNKNLNNFETPIGLDKFLLEFLEYANGEVPDKSPHNHDTFDFIVVGAGTAGATIASRLSEVSKIKVLLIEAGGDENIVMDIPLIAHNLQFSDEINWKYQTEPSNDYCTGMIDKRCNFPKGKVMGGSSVLNYMIATRGDPKDYDRWAELGNEGWSWKDVLPYFKKLENFNVFIHKNNSKAHNYNGPVYVNDTRFQTPLARAFLEAGIELGYKANIDYNSGEESIGFSYLQTTMKNGLRQSSNVAYLRPAKLRKNLIVTKKSVVSRILFDFHNRRAIGVEYIKGNQKYRVYAKKEVILSAGSIASPQILMLSGIGHTEHLKQNNILPILNLPVGDNLMDHVGCGGLIFTLNQSVSLRNSDIFNPLNPYLRDYLLYRNGPLTLPGGVEALAFLNVDKPNDQTAHANMELVFGPMSLGAMKSFSTSLGLSNELWEKTYSELEDTYTMTIFPVLLIPKSRGQIRLRDNNILSKPKIFAHYFEDKEDVRVLIKGIKTALQLSKTSAMQKYGVKLFRAHLPQCRGIPEGSDNFWECVLRTMTLTYWHYAGTCKMGPKNDSTAVVDARLRVHGIKGLRVADASIMPEIPRAHLNIPTFMIGEKLADMVKKDWGC